MKRNYKYLFVLIISIMMLSATTTYAKQIMTPQKEQFATVTNGKVNKNKVKPGDTLKYSFTVSNKDIQRFDSNHGYENGFDHGVYDVKLIWQSPKKQRIERTYQWSAGKKSLKISGKIKIDKGMQKGNWKLEKIYLNSGSGEDEYETICIYDARAEKDKYEYDAIPPEEMCEYIDLSFADFKVSKTGAKADNKAPTISAKSMKVSNYSIKEKESSIFSLKVEDQGEIKKVICYWSIYEKGNKHGSDVDYIMKYNKKQKRYQCSIKLGKTGKNAKIDGIYVEDIYGNGKLYTTGKYKKAFSKMIITKKKA